MLTMQRLIGTGQTTAVFGPIPKGARIRSVTLCPTSDTAADQRVLVNFAMFTNRPASVGEFQSAGQPLVEALPLNSGVHIPCDDSVRLPLNIEVLSSPFFGVILAGATGAPDAGNPQMLVAIELDYQQVY